MAVGALTRGRGLRALTMQCLFALGSLVGFLLLPGTVHQASAAAQPAKTSNTTIIAVQPTSVTSTTPNACSAALNECTREVLAIINHDRAQHNLSSLTLETHQSVGTRSCVGSYGHSVAMAKSNAIWHVNPRYPRASFPKSICVPFMHAGENVGESASGNVHDDFRTLDAMMMAEPHDRQTCATAVSHACNILNPAFKRVGIGVRYIGSVTWLTEDFTG